MGTVFAQLFDLAMQIERERFLGAQLYERILTGRAMPTVTKRSGSTRPRGLSRSMYPRRLAMMENRSIPTPLIAVAARFGP